MTSPTSPTRTVGMISPLSPTGAVDMISPTSPSHPQSPQGVGHHIQQHREAPNQQAAARKGRPFSSFILESCYHQCHIFPCHLITTFMWGRRYTPPCSSVVHFLPRQSLLFDITPHSVQPSSLRPSRLPHLLYSHFCLPLSYMSYHF